MHLLEKIANMIFLRQPRWFYSLRILEEIGSHFPRWFQHVSTPDRFVVICRPLFFQQDSDVTDSLGRRKMGYTYTQIVIFYSENDDHPMDFTGHGVGRFSDKVHDNGKVKKKIEMT